MFQQKPDDSGLLVRVEIGRSSVTAYYQTLSGTVTKQHRNRSYWLKRCKNESTGKSVNGDTITYYFS